MNPGGQFLLGIADDLVVDLFAGGGGASTGIEQAIGRHVDIAVNHDAKAVSLHQANHPQTKHFIADVFEVKPLEVTEGRPVGLLWASPDCKHFSKAKGGKPVSKKIRGLAWVVVDWARTVRPRVICLENVEEFRTWGPLTADNMPDPARKGETFDEWKAALEALGYVVEHRELRACDYGAPTIRKRLFLVARCDGQPITWPQATHAAKPAKGSALLPYRTAADCIDWTIPCPSIFERERELAPATLRRIAHGIKRYVLDAAKPYIVRIGQTGHGDGGKTRSIDDPLSTITSKAEHLLAAPVLIDAAHSDVSPSGVKRWSHGNRPATNPMPTVVSSGGNQALVAAFLAKHYGGNETPGIAVGGPISTITTQDHHHLVAAQLVGCGGRAGQSRPRSADEPVQTITAKGDTCLVTSNLAKLRGTSNSADVAQPLHTISAGGEHHAEVRALLMKYYGTDQDPDLHEPLHTVTTKDRFGLVTVQGEDYFIADIGMRMLQPRELYRAQGFPDTYIIDRGHDGRPLAKSDQVRMCGNSVCPPLARAIVLANYVDSSMMREAA
jgi:DNA (cytosine-5)-methyltransferase 1